MSRSGYSNDCDDYDDYDDWALIRWRGAVASAIRGKRGQAFLREMLLSLDKLPEKRLITEELYQDEEVCAIGSVGLHRNIDMSKIDPYDRESIANTFGISMSMAAEIMDINDSWGRETSEERWARVRKWVESNIT